MRIELDKTELLALLLRVLPGSGLNMTHLAEVDFNRGQQSLTFTFDLPRVELHREPTKMHAVATLGD